MTTLPDQPAASPAVSPESPASYALVGNPNTGKSTLFNRLCGVRSKTANFPGSTVEARIGSLDANVIRCRIVDLPGVYGLNLDRPESRVCRKYLDGHLDGPPAPEALLVVVDATNLQRNLILAGQALSHGLPAVVALNMFDLAPRRGLTIDVERLQRQLGCPVIPISARSGHGVRTLLDTLVAPTVPAPTIPREADVDAMAAWAATIASDCVDVDAKVEDVETFTDRCDRVLTHPVGGVAAFALVMTALFFTIFSLATIPMDLIEAIFGTVGGWVATVLPAGAIRDLLVDGVIGGIAGTVVFLPQICLLFFMISVLEDTGYLARASFVMDRHLRRFGLPGQSFVPLLSAHACAIPAIMSSRLIPDRRDRLAVILVAPFMSCSARLPVYVLLIGILFADNALHAGLAFAGCYLLGAVAALLTAFVFRRTLLRGPSRPMVLELPGYKIPSLRTALMTTWDRAIVFLRKAGTVILSICIVLWWLSAYPTSDPPPEAVALQTQAESLRATAPAEADAAERQAGIITARHASASSFAGRIGHALEPVFEPLGYDWQLSIGVVTSFAAREVFVSTLAVLFAASDDTEDPSVLDRITRAERDDGSAVFTKSTAASLLVFYVLAMQCLPTLAVTRRETGSWKWALIQLVYMSLVAYVAALLVRGLCLALGVA